MRRGWESFGHDGSSITISIIHCWQNDVIIIIVDAVFQGKKQSFVAKTMLKKKLPRQHTTKGVSNALMWVFLFEYCVGGGEASTMVQLVPNYGERRKGG